MSGEDRGQNDSRRRRWQFSLRSLFVCVTVVCLALGVARFPSDWWVFLVAFIVAVVAKGVESLGKGDEHDFRSVVGAMVRGSWLGVAGALDGMIVAFVIVGVLNGGFRLTVELVPALWIGALAGGAFGIAFPRILARIGFPFY